MTKPVRQTVLCCENERDGCLCGHWIVVTRGDLPICPNCRRGERHWRVVTEAEIRKRDHVFLSSLRIDSRDPSRHLGAVEDES